MDLYVRKIPDIYCKEINQARQRFIYPIQLNKKEKIKGLLLCQSIYFGWPKSHIKFNKFIPIRPYQFHKLISDYFQIK